MNAVLERAMSVTEAQKRAFYRKYQKRLNDERRRGRFNQILETTQVIVVIALFDAVIIAALLMM